MSADHALERIDFSSFEAKKFLRDTVGKRATLTAELLAKMTSLRKLSFTLPPLARLKDIDSRQGRSIAVLVYLNRIAIRTKTQSIGGHSASWHFRSRSVPFLITGAQGTEGPQAGA